MAADWCLRAAWRVLVGCPESEAAKREAGGACTSANECVTGLTCTNSRVWTPLREREIHVRSDSNCMAGLTCVTSTSTCVDNRPLVSLGTPSPAALTEDDDATGSATIAVTISPAPTAAVSVVLMVTADPTPNIDDYGYAVVSADGVTPSTATTAGLPVTVAFDATTTMRTLTINTGADVNTASETLTIAAQPRHRLSYR